MYVRTASGVRSYTSKEEKKYPTWVMYVRTACGVRVVFLDGAWSSLHLQVAYLGLPVGAVCSVSFFFLVSERSRQNSPVREGLVST